MFFVFNAIGSASSEILDLLGLNDSEKLIALCLQPCFRMQSLMTTVAEGLEFHKPGNGIAFTIPLSGVSSPVTSMLSDDIQRLKERLDEQMEVEMEKSREEATHDLIVASVNQGFSDDLMEAAREAGATGGTLIHARKIGMDEVVKFFGISLQAEKEIVTILTVKKDKKAIMQAINKACGMRTEARGVFFSLPVDSVTGISHDED